MATELPAVLVTRPSGQGDSLKGRLRQLGYRPLHQPMLELTALEEVSPQQRQLLLDLDLYEHVIFISANAVRFGFSLIDDYWPQLPAGLGWYAIGGITAGLLAERGLDVIEPGAEMSSEGLLAVESLQDVAGARVLIVKGQGGRDTLRRELDARGARVDELACYTRRCPVLPAGELGELLSREQIETVLISSGEGLQNMLTLLSEEESTKFRDIRLVVPSPRVEKQAREAGFTQVKTAANASDEAMLAAL
ncbi:uroporphyrinogen-III synthase [Halioglobus maricola]|uniref:Uroporphyrinogen-III synthase n=1 Tax=Halioglobus maricola TaxID=2601894 RepID=A0A5P9NQH7_9GAMM|nr:uroporphyrinogen-III synthase [Halioglobus maricola]QFU77118.1 uroporphyrinogen-III synthase [Halioglobus maricola]